MMDEEKRYDEPVSRYWHEADLARADENAKRLLRALVATIILFVVTTIVLLYVNYRNNQKWIDMFAEYDFVGCEISADDDSNATYVGNDNIGGIYN